MTTRPNPYVGPRSFEPNETLYGRDRELRMLSAQLISERVVLLHSPSGAGKTSLIQAGLIPLLREEKFNILPVIRVNLEPEADLAHLDGFNRYTYSVIASLEENLPPEQRQSPASLAVSTLEAYLSSRPRPADAPRSDLLLFDQFEEILTVDSTDREGKQAFFAQLGAALRNSNRWALFAMREDYLGALAPYVRPIPNRFEATFRLDLLGVEPALQAIQRPAREAGVDFTDEVAQKLVDDLRRVQVQQVDGSMASVLGQHIEPVQLQVVCFRLWQSLGADDTSINLDDIAAIGDVDQSLGDYYAMSVTSAAAQTGLNERTLREWFETKLITKEGIRGQVLMGAEASDGLDNRAVRLLENAHIIRGEKRAGATWFELSHDRLILPVRKNNTAWFEKNLSLLQRQAALWEQERHPEGLLLRDKELEAAKVWAGQHALELLQTERDFLQACWKENSRIKRERLRNMALAILAFIASSLAIMAVGFGVWGWNRAKQAEYQAQLALAGKLAAQAQTYQDQQLDLALLLGVEAYQRATGPLQQSSLLTVVDYNPRLNIFLHAHKSGVHSVAFSPDGKLMASGSDDKTIIVWDTATHQPIGEPLKGHQVGVMSLAFSPDGKILASGSKDSTIILWDLSTRQPVGTPLTGHTWVVASVAFSPDGKMLASGSYDQSVILWDVATRQISGKLFGKGGSALSVAFSPDGKTLVSGNWDSSIIFWDIATRQMLGQPLMHGTGSVTSLAFSPDGHKLASGAWNHQIVFWDVATRQQLGTLVGHEHVIETVKFSPDGKTLASGSDDGILILWDVATQQKLEAPLTGLSSGIWSVTFSPDGQTLASSHRDGTILLWNTGSLHTHDLLAGHTNLVKSVAFSPNGQILASGSDDGTIIFWDAISHQQLSAPLGGQSFQVTSLAFSPDGQMLASGSCSQVDESNICIQGEIILWNTATHERIGEPLKGHAGLVSSLAFSPDGKILASGSDDYTLILWDLVTKQPLGESLKEQNGSILGLAFSPDGKVLASGSCNEGDMNGDCIRGEITLWDVAARRALGNPLIGHSNWVEAVTFSPDGKILASGSDDNTILFWDVTTRQVIGAPLTGHSKEVTSLVFSPNGKILASGSHDQTTRLWDVATRQFLGVSMSGGYWSVYSVVFSPDGKTVASGSCNKAQGGCIQGGVFLWNIDPDSWITRACQRANRNLSLQEWQQYLGDQEPYRATCPQWPLGLTP